jgi:hypothetical protein
MAPLSRPSGFTISLEIVATRTLPLTIWNAGLLFDNKRDRLVSNGARYPIIMRRGHFYSRDLERSDLTTPSAEPSIFTQTSTAPDPSGSGPVVCCLVGRGIFLLAMNSECGLRPLGLTIPWVDIYQGCFLATTKL